MVVFCYRSLVKTVLWRLLPTGLVCCCFWIMIFQRCFMVKNARFCTAPDVAKKVKYSDSVLLPKTKFQQHLNAKLTVERDARILEECGFSELYAWQRKNARGKEFVLLDGPPYANGKVHIGHAINKILKDIIIRSHLLRGRRIHFIPGWDCHGLPIELKAGKTTDGDSVAIRKRARDFAKNAVEDQKSAFKNWGVMADWDHQVYHTYDKEYVIRQLQIFWELFNQGLLYRDLKPVYWSPSSRTALAEAELVYKEDHVSNAVTVRLEVVNPNFVTSSTPVYVLIWTTTPWTLPVNEAVCYSKNLNYSLVSIYGLDGLYIICSSSVAELETKWQREIKVVKNLEPHDWDGVQYKHPWRKNELRPVLESQHVTASGTGLVHSAPAHGHDDFLVGLRYNLSKTSLVDGQGRYTPEAGAELSGKSVLNEGSEFVVKNLEKDIVHQERYTHSYPYDWRTNKPVLIRSSQQWFIDTRSIKDSALECLKSVHGSTERLHSLLNARPYWCVSRQRAWGVPIPAFYHKTSGRPLISKSSINQLCQLINNGETDAWWTQPVSKLFPKSACQELFVSQDEIQKGSDIMDIWLDSGVAWSGLESRIADVCLEGGDQHTGWFQSSLLTSVAIQGKAPARHLLTHGFAVDDEGKKMSKSVGNVVDPDRVMKTAGVDALRWWTANHAHHPLIPASDRHFQAARESVIRLRGTLRFLLGAINGLDLNELTQKPVYVLDRYMLDACKNLHQSVMEAYESYAWNQVGKLVVNFATGPVSGLYVHVIKDRLYCDLADSTRRRSCRMVLNGILETMTSCLAPILPHLAEEVYEHSPIQKGRFWFRGKSWEPPHSWKDENAVEVCKRALEIKTEVDKLVGTAGSSHFSCNLQLNETDWNTFNYLQNVEESWDSELTELLQLASIRKLAGYETSVVLNEAITRKCPRCRRYTARDLSVMCDRCLKCHGSN